MRRGLLLGGVGLAMLTAGPALAKSVCYELVDVDGGDPLQTAVRWDVDPNGRLTSSSEAVAMNTYTVHGNFVSDLVAPPVFTLPVQGTITVGHGVGARGGFHSPALIAGNQWMALECETEEDSATPESWFCRILIYDVPSNAFLEPQDFDLVKVDPREFELCGKFGEIPTPPPPAEEPEGGSE